MKVRTYSEMIRHQTLEDRFRYLKLDGSVVDQTFGYDRWMNQSFYRSHQWKEIRRHVIIRDNACDLAVADHEIHDRILVHHMNPIQLNQLAEGDDSVLDPEFLITVSHNTHNAIHYGDAGLLPQPYVERRPGDHIDW